MAPAFALAPAILRRGAAVVRRQRASVVMSRSLRVALCQVRVGADKGANLRGARDAVARAKDAGAELAVLPECFNCPYDTGVFAEYAERAPGVGESVEGCETAGVLSKAAKDAGIVVVGGSFPEICDGSVYNTCLCFGKDGEVVAKHRKVHLFDVDCSATGGIVFKESDALSAGADLTVFDAMDGVRVGVGICYDVRFPDLSMAMVRGRGANFLVFPGAFNMFTGPRHWELLARARAVDNQCFVAMCSPARDTEAGYVAWGHSTIVDAWGAVAAKAGVGEEMLVHDIDLSMLDTVQTAVPTSTQRRMDVYAQPEKK